MNLKKTLRKYKLYIRHHKIFGEVYELINGTIGDYVRDHGLIYAAAVAFYTLLSIIPLLVLFASAAGFAVFLYGDGSEESVNTIVAEMLMHLKKIMPFIGPGLEEDIRGLIQNRQGLGAVGFVTLLLSSSQMFRALEFSFVRIFSRATYDEVSGRFRQPTNILLSKLIFAAFIVSLITGYITFRLGLSLVLPLTEHLPFELGQTIRTILGESSWTTDILSAISVILGFAVILKFFSYNKVKFRFSCAGGLVFYVAWQITRITYEYFLNEWTNLGALYGSFAIVMASVLWIFVSSVLVVMCGYFVRTIQRRWTYGSQWAGKPRPSIDP